MVLGAKPPPSIQTRSSRAARQSVVEARSSGHFESELANLEAKAARKQQRVELSGTPRGPRPLPTISEPSPPSYETFPANSPRYAHDSLISHRCPLPQSSLDNMESCVAELIYDACVGKETRTEPISSWIDCGPDPNDLGHASRIDHDTFIIDVDASQASSQVSLLASAMGVENDALWPAFQSALLSEATSGPMSVFDYLPIHRALRADSAGAPDTHRRAVEMGEPWPSSELKELKNHETNGSFVKVRQCDVPKGRRTHRLVWVYKLKRDGTAKARLCVQGCTLEGGVDYDQTFASALKYTARLAAYSLTLRAPVVLYAASTLLLHTSKVSSSRASVCTFTCPLATKKRTRQGALMCSRW